MDEEAKTPDINQARPAASSGGVTVPPELKRSRRPQMPDNKPANRLENYFATGVQLLTLPGSEIMINDDTRRLLALFSNGRFLVSETHKFDGRVLSFEVLARKKKLLINKPTYVSQNELNAIYAYGGTGHFQQPTIQSSTSTRWKCRKTLLTLLPEPRPKKCRIFMLLSQTAHRLCFALTA